MCDTNFSGAKYIATIAKCKRVAADTNGHERKNIQCDGPPLWVVLILLGISAFISYVDRASLSIAAPILKDELGLSASQLDVLLSSFFWSYVSLQLVAGWLADRVNVSWFLAGGFFLCSGATLGTGLVHGFVLLLLFRMLLGIGESVVYPSYSRIILLHYREEHRGVANSIISAGWRWGRERAC